MASHVETSSLGFSSIGRRVAVSFQTSLGGAVGGGMCLRRIVDWDAEAKTITVMNCEDAEGTEATVAERFVFWWGGARQQKTFKERPRRNFIQDEMERLLKEFEERRQDGCDAGDYQWD